MTIYCLCSYAKCGKDTLARLHPKFKRISLHDELKYQVSEITKQYIDVDMSTLNDENNNVNFRPLLDAWLESTKNIDYDYWIKKLGIDNTQDYICTDSLHLNEILLLKNIGAKIIYISRPKCFASTPIEHAIINEVLSNRMFDFYVINDGSIEELKHDTEFMEHSGDDCKRFYVEYLKKRNIYDDK